MKLLFGILTLLSTSVFAQIKMDSIVKGIHLLNYYSDSDCELLIKQLPAFEEKGINTIFLQVDYRFDFQSYPELAQGKDPITKVGAGRLAKKCKEHNIKIVPQFSCIGHQSWAENTWAFLTRYPQYDLTPGAFPGNDSIYCREWDITNPEVNKIIFKLIDEIVEGFQVDGIHLGMDEVFLIGNNRSPNTRGKNVAELFAKTINEYHDYFVKEKGLDIYMWADRLIDGTKYSYGAWEASLNGTHPAIDLIPKDIIMCDWHYNQRNTYPSVDLFLEKGFRVIPCSFKDVDAASKFIKYSFGTNHPNMIGHMFTTWSVAKNEDILDWPAMSVGLDAINNEKFHDVLIKNALTSMPGEIEITLSVPKEELKIHYTIDGSIPTIESPVYTGPFIIKNSCSVQAIAFNSKNEKSGDLTSSDFSLHKAVGKKIVLLNAPSEKYIAADAENALLNGISGSAGFSDGEWVGFEGDDLEAIISLDEVEFSKIKLTFHNAVNSWIHHAAMVEVYTSDDGETFTLLKSQDVRKTGKQTLQVKVNFDAPIKSKFIKVVAKNQLIPEGFVGAGNPAWLFVDEIEIL